MPNIEKVNTRLSEIINAKMEERGVSINDVAKSTGVSYEHMRRVARGVVPSRFILKAICDELKLPFKQLQELADEAKMREKYGDLPLKLAGKTPSLEPLERIWSKLSEQQQEDLIYMAKSWLRRGPAAVANSKVAAV